MVKKYGITVLLIGIAILLMYLNSGCGRIIKEAGDTKYDTKYIYVATGNATITLNYTDDGVSINIDPQVADQEIYVSKIKYSGFTTAYDGVNNGFDGQWIEVFVRHPNLNPSITLKTKNATHTFNTNISNGGYLRLVFANANQCIIQPAWYFVEYTNNPQVDKGTGDFIEISISGNVQQTIYMNQF